jgi:hypothetical protein
MPGRARRWRIALTIQCLVMCCVSSACVQAGGILRPGWVPIIPPRPSLRHAPLPGRCAIGEDEAVRCWAILDEDVRDLLQWALTLERDLRAACLALGGRPQQCGTDAPGSPDPEPSQPGP